MGRGRLSGYLKPRLLIAEIKRNKARISLTELQKKAPRLLEAYRGYEVEYRALSLEDAEDFLA
jgi:hypothetical protein